MSAVFRRLLVGCSLCAGVRAMAQAPHITPAGDPSIASDSIYRLAVDSTAYPEQSTVLLLDDGVVRMDADGQGTRTYRQVVQVLRTRAVAGLQEREFSYDPDRQRLTVNWIRVLKLDGDVISAKPSQTQESDVPAALGESGVHPPPGHSLFPQRRSTGDTGRRELHTRGAQAVPEWTI